MMGRYTIRVGLMVCTLLVSVHLVGCAVSAGPPATLVPHTVFPLSTAADPASTPDVAPTAVADVLAMAQVPAAASARLKTLTICMRGEPVSLLPYLDAGYAARMVRAVLFGTSIDSAGYTYRSDLLQSVPSLEDGSAVLKLVRVAAGDVVVDADGAVVELAAGTRVQPAGCRQAGCAVVYDGDPLEMDQLMAVFELRPELVWPDGTPVVADDSVFAFELASNVAMPHDQTLEERTQSYVVLDGSVAQDTVVWTGVPGFLPQNYATAFWAPLPSAWRDVPLAKLLQRDDVVRTPPGCGPYTVASWNAGVAIRLVRNPAYEGTRPTFDEVTFRFVNDSAVSGAGSCDLLASDTTGVSVAGAIRGADGVRLMAQPDAAWDHLVFNVGVGRADSALLTDVRMRQAVAACVDRAEVNDVATGGLGTVLDSYVPPDHPLYVADAAIQGAFAPDRGAALLAQVGWSDVDGDGIRESYGVAGVPDGTPLRLRYATTSAPERRTVADVIAQQLAGCGIALDVTLYAPWELYAQNATGILVGGAFDLAQTALPVGVHPDCEAYVSWAVPGDANDWTGRNVGRYSDVAFDTACAVASTALPGEDAYASAQREVQALFGAKLPVLPLYRGASAVEVRADLMGVAPAPLAVEMWNIVTWGLATGD